MAHRSDEDEFAMRGTVRNNVLRITKIKTKNQMKTSFSMK